jgi:hypothetical protein
MYPLWGIGGANQTSVLPWRDSRALVREEDWDRERGEDYSVSPFSQSNAFTETRHAFDL